MTSDDNLEYLSKIHDALERADIQIERCEKAYHYLIAMGAPQDAIDSVETTWQSFVEMRLLVTRMNEYIMLADEQIERYQAFLDKAKESHSGD